MTETPLSLLDRIRRQAHPEDWDRIVSLYTPLLHGWLHRYPVQGADVDDLVQDVLSVLLEKLPLFKHSGQTGAFRTWLRRILVFQIRHFWRVRGRGSYLPTAAAELQLNQLEAPESEITRQWNLEHDRHVVRQLLEQLQSEFTPTTWQAFEQYAVHCRPPAEVAAELHLSVNAVLIARSRVLRRLREEAAGLLD